LKDYTSPYNATVVERILSEGGVVVGKTNHDEFAMGSSNEHSVFGHAKNPVDSELVPGGSSGGSAISVALGLTDMALGSDTGGSIRQPAAFCGVYGLKPTYGRVSRYGLVAFASSFDQIGPFANTTHDLALLTEVISGVDQNETTSVDKEVPPFVESLGSDVPKNIGVPWSILEKGVEPEILDRLKSLTGFLEGKGFDIISIDLPNLKYNIAVYYILTMAEASSNLARYDGVRYGLSERDDSWERMCFRPDIMMLIIEKHSRCGD
jgi:aspartyl-tRNA(Asn)/glutamyl-tRNA(Gln) amidotransferase subunit A